MGRRTRVSALAVVTSVLALAGSVAGCGNSGSSAPTTSASSPSGSTPTTTGSTAATAPFGGTHVRGFLISQEMSTCPNGGAIVHWLQGQTSLVTQGSPLKMPRGINYAPNGDPTGSLIIADGVAGLFTMPGAGGTPTRLASSPPSSPRDVITDPQGNYLVADWPVLHGQPVTFGELGFKPGGGVSSTSVPGATPAAIYRVTPAGQVTTVFSGAPLVTPHGLTLDSAGDVIVADPASGVVRITPQGQATVVVQVGSTTGLESVMDVAIDASGNYIVTDGFAGALDKVSPSGVLTTIHKGAPFSTVNPSAQLAGPRGVVVEADGSYDVVDQTAKALFHVTTSGQVSTVTQGGLLCDPADLVIVHD